MVEGILFLLLSCCGILIILGLILVLLGGLGALLGGAAEAYDQPKKLLYFLYFGSMVMGLAWILASLGVDLDLEGFVAEQSTPQDALGIFFLIYSSAVLIYHAMDYLWHRIGLADLPEPPKLRWAYGGANIWCALSFYFLETLPPHDPEMQGLAPIMFMFGLALVWWATTEKKKMR